MLSGPSGVGKGTVRSALFERDNHKLIYSISATTRLPRAGEVDGVDYFFKTREEFEAMINNSEFIEYAEFVGNYYGTPKKYVEDQLAAGQDVILEIEVQGAAQVHKMFTDAVFIFLAPPSLKELRKRLEGRGTEEDDVIAGRLETAIREIILMSEYDYAVINDDVQTAVDKIQTIIQAEHYRVKYIEDSLKNKILLDTLGGN